MLSSAAAAAATSGTTTQSAQSEAKLKDDLNKFLNLLVTQLKHQDPLDPMDSTEFTSQLVQFAGVEQQIYQNANLEKLIGLQQGSQISSLVNYIGMRVEAAGQKMPLEYGSGQFTYTLDSKADRATIHIVNDKGLTVYTTDGEITAGRHEYTWDGRDKNGIAQPSGDYSVIVTAQDRDGVMQKVAYTVFGYVNGATTENGKVSLLMGGGIEVPMENVKAVTQ